MTPEQEREARAADKQDREFRDAMVALTKTAGWSMYRDRLNLLLGNMGSLLMVPLAAAEGDPMGFLARERQEHLKGTMNGLVLARDLPANTIAGMEVGRGTTERDDDAD